LGQVELDELLSKREDLSKRIQVLLDNATEPWGIKVSAVTLRDVSLPDTMVRAIAKQAEAERERRSRVIMAEGEFQAAEKMREAGTGAPTDRPLDDARTHGDALNSGARPSSAPRGRDWCNRSLDRRVH